jgi:2-polyprenyl-3-methyl-5-hydroxy-6-metoxy-1,4-benzoquinol methylase
LKKKNALRKFQASFTQDRFFAPKEPREKNCKQHRHAMNSHNPAYVSPRPDILALVPTTARCVLDVGCSNGALGKSIKQSQPGARVVGMEVSADMAEDARAHLDQVLIGDIEHPQAFDALGGQRFDTIIFADVLEHLKDPWSMLEKIRPFLLPNGVVITSIPNVRHMDTIFNLVIKGRWPYRDRGIHDRTHLRFFTKRNIEELFAGASFKIDAMRTNYRFFERPHPWNRYAKAAALPGLAPFLAFQYLLLARPVALNDQE